MSRIGPSNYTTTADVSATPAIECTAQLATSLKIGADPNSRTTPPRPNGAGYQQRFEDFWHQYQTSDVPDLAAGLKDIDQQIDDATALTTGP